MKSPSENRKGPAGKEGNPLSEKNLRVCNNGHTYYKSSDCPVCPACEKEKHSGKGFLTALAAPARRALESAGVKSLKQLSRFSEKELLKLHGIGKTSLPVLKAELKKHGLSFSKDK